MDIKQNLDAIWSQNYIKSLPPQIQRGYCFAENNEQKPILVTGFNPSFREGQNHTESSGYCVDFFDSTHDNYFSPIKKMLHDDELNIDLRNDAAYMDLFYFQEQDQEFLRKQILPLADGIRFTIEQLNLTQHIIEDIIKPKLIVVKNKESWAYFGKLFVELLDSNERIAPEIKETNLKGTFVLFTQHINQYTAVEKRPKAEQLLNIKLWAKSEKTTREYAK